MARPYIRVIFFVAFRKSGRACSNRSLWAIDDTRQGASSYARHGDMAQCTTTSLSGHIASKRGAQMSHWRAQVSHWRARMSDWGARVSIRDVEMSHWHAILAVAGGRAYAVNESAKPVGQALPCLTAAPSSATGAGQMDRRRELVVSGVRSWAECSLGITKTRKTESTNEGWFDATTRGRDHRIDGMQVAAGRSG